MDINSGKVLLQRMLFFPVKFFKILKHHFNDQAIVF